MFIFFQWLIMNDYYTTFEKKMFEWIIKWITSFVKNRRTTLLFTQHKTKYRNIRTDLSQNSLMSFILYLFFNADLLKLLNRLNVKITIINFVNNVNLLIVDQFIEKNCMTLSRIYVVCARVAATDRKSVGSPSVWAPTEAFLAEIPIRWRNRKQMPWKPSETKLKKFHLVSRKPQKKDAKFQRTSSKGVQQTK